MNFASLRRAAWRISIGAATRALLPLRARDRRVAVFYSGAHGGDFGGTLVKVRALARRFPEQRVGFSLLYMLSGGIYLPQSTIEAVRRAGVPIVLNQNGIYYKAWYPNGWERENARMAGVHAAADHVFYQSEFCRRCAEQFLGPRHGPGEILYNGVDTNRFHPADITKSRPFTFLGTGKITSAIAYRLISSIEGLAAARKGGLDVRLIFSGAIDPDIETQARALIERLGVADAVSLTGAYRESEAPSIYQSADAYLITKHNDPCPNVVLEAMASGLPVLYSASGGVPEQVGEEAGVGLAVPQTFETSPIPSPSAVAEGMARIIREHQTMRQAARQRAVARFDLTHWLDRHQQVFEQLVRGGPGQARP